MRVDEKDEFLHWSDGILTLGDFRRLTADLPDSAQIALATEDWYDNVESIALPAKPDLDGDVEGWPHSDWSAITLFHGTELNTRQF